ncbi:DnaT-like ssDNA-binding protein [Aureimonas glaciei]|uniref:Putative DnaT-like domain-containing protein n=1 Tax=Aureimonas glaciei TaxID=1776957 RepID=A0A916YGB3_9HYPH|nr:DnaT-like ssDNA-binding protein [Aureimonas glaciei]GGD43467.1 hypothetical protein GCM10011335_52620 [Aureimonas glaciei]
MADTYGTRAEADAYLLARGSTAWASATETARDAALIRASGYIDGRYRARFSGRKAEGRAQTREWPRVGATDASGEEIGETEVPSEVLDATFEAAARELSSPGSLAPDFDAGTLIKREKVGPIETEYATPIDAAAARPVVSIIDDILSGLLTSDSATTTGGVSFLLRA